ncbi:hypothetical protein [Phytohabitans suffuscus]|uniref:Uncharacterized protein n=1 Tax=Phytohabitans suffuscus TaxID=624315 RepID=A0A6F8YVT9_9ACTN|nr:hypothetical protein [Phytohabitans suffuscus]BCB90257.1 hypothetical protein Psuf_075700 [Phytohabitans suffuscus]
MTTPAKRVARWLKVAGFLGFAAVGVVVWLVVAPPSFDSGTVVPAPDAEMAVATSDQLARAASAQGVCYGWRLESYSTGTSVGSNLGSGVAIDPSRCPKWVEVRADVMWTSSSSEAADSATVTIASSGVPAPPSSRLDRFGLTGSAFVDEPDWAICQAALALPLLVAESGAVPPAPAVTAGAAAGPAPDAGSDFWRDRWPYVLGAAILLALGALIVVIGWFERKHERTRPKGRRGRPTPAKAAAKPVAAGAAEPGAPGAGAAGGA